MRVRDIILASSRLPPEALGADLLCYWDARDTARITIATGISSWLDRVGGFNMVQATGSRQPTLAGGWASFDAAATQFLRCTDAGLIAVLPTGAAPCEMWALVDITSTLADGTVRRIATYGGAAGNNDSRQIIRTIDGRNFGQGLVGSGAGQFNRYDQTVDFTGPQVIHLAVGATASTLQISNGAPGTFAGVPATAATVTNLTMGALTTTDSNSLQGRLAVLAITRPLTPQVQHGFRNGLLARRYQ